MKLVQFFILCWLLVGNVYANSDQLAQCQNYRDQFFVDQGIMDTLRMKIQAFINVGISKLTNDQLKTWIALMDQAKALQQTMDELKSKIDICNFSVNQRSNISELAP